MKKKAAALAKPEAKKKSESKNHEPKKEPEHYYVHSMSPHAEQTAFIESRAKRKVIRAGRRGGKAQPLISKVYTPTGPKMMGRLKIGDEVLTPFGTVATIEGIFPQGTVDIYTVTFGDASSTDCTLDHLWEINEKRTDRSWKSRDRIVTAEDLRQMATVIQEGRGTSHRPTIPITAPVSFAEQPVPLHPYLLGVLIGDGTFMGESVNLSCADSWLIEKVKDLCPKGTSLKKIAQKDRPHYDYSLTCGRTGKKNAVVQAIKALGLWHHYSHEKFIPDCYKYNSTSVRIDVIRGLLDTDGSVKRGQPLFEQTSRRLADDFREVIESLGGLCKQSQKMGGYKREGVRIQTRQVYRQSVLYPDPSELFACPAKKLKTRVKKQKTQRYIQGVKFSRKAEAQCIKISDPRGLYLTDHFIATHNTIGVAILAVRAFVVGKRVLYAAPTVNQLDVFWNECVTALSDMIILGQLRKNETEHSIEWVKKQGRIRAKTAWNADTLRGDYADMLILDEWQLMDEDAWGTVGAPMLLDNNGDAVFIYTPPSLRSRSVSKARDPRHASKMFQRAAEDKTGRWATFHFSSHQNPHISEQALADITMDMTALSYRQEIMAEDVDEVPGALWSRAVIDNSRVLAAPADLARIVVAIDPSASSKDTSDEAGIVVGALGADGHGYLLRDVSRRDTPKGWASAAVAQYHALKADRIVGEVNNGGEMVELTVRTVDENVSYRAVTASRGKLTRAEPVCALYERNIIHHVGEFPELEDEMCSYVPGEKSPNRMDAMVWLFTELMLESQALGLIDYYKSGRAEADLKQMEKVAVATTLAKPMIPEQAPGCPECGAKIVARVAGGQMRCNQCGVQWWPKGSAPARHGGMSRSDMLAGMGR